MKFVFLCNLLTSTLSIFKKKNVMAIIVTIDTSFPKNKLPAVLIINKVVILYHRKQ